jgi:hypothetical protein
MNSMPQDNSLCLVSISVHLPFLVIGLALKILLEEKHPTGTIQVDFFLYSASILFLNTLFEHQRLEMMYTLRMR